MRREIIWGTLFAAAIAVGVSAQSAQSGYSQSEKGQTVTLTGCLERGSQAGATGTTGTAGAPSTTTGAAGSAEFVLKDVQESGKPTAGTTGTTTPEPSTSMSSSWANGLKLQASPSEDLSKYVNHKVEIRGTVEKASSSGATTSPTTPPAGATGSMASSGNLPTLRVSSIKDISSSCSGAEK